VRAPFSMRKRCFFLVLCASAALATLAVAGERKPIQGHLAELPDLGITREAATKRLADHAKLVQRESKTPGVENWWSHSDNQQLVFSLKMVKEKVIAASIEVPGVVSSDDMMVKRMAFAIRALANVDPDGQWDGSRAGAVGSSIAKVRTPPYKPIAGRTGRNFVYFLYFPKRNAVQVNVLPVALIENYEADAL
jgi:hypothetical protein